MDKIEIKELLTPGSYEKIADEIGLRRSTVSQYFSKNGVRTSEETEKKIIEIAKRMIEENAWRGLKATYEEQQVNQIRKSLAA